MITQSFDLNLIPDSSPVVVHCDQYDKGTGRLVISLYDGSIAYSPSGTATIQGVKPDGKGFSYNVTLSGNVVTANLTEQMTAVAGRVRCQIVVTESTGRTGSFAFILDVQPSALPLDTDISESDYQFIEQAIEAAQDAEESSEDAEAWAVGERGGVPVGPTDETYHNNAKYWSEQAASIGDLDDLNDVTITTPSNNQVLTYDANSGDWVNANPQAVPSALDDLSDVDISSPTNGQALIYNSTSQEWENQSVPSAATDLDDLTDVTLTSPTSGQVLKYDGSKWVNGSGGGGGDYMGLYGMTEIQSSDGQGTTLLDLDQYTSVGNYYCEGKAEISLPYHSITGGNTVQYDTISNANFLLYVRTLPNDFLLQDLYEVHTNPDKIFHYYRYGKKSGGIWSLATEWDYVVNTGSYSPHAKPNRLDNSMGNLSISSLANGDALIQNNGYWTNKPIGEATGLASINTTGATNTTGSTITAGTYFYLDGVLVRALANIANGASYTLNTNYEVVTVGALNEVYTGGNSLQTFIDIAYGNPYHSQTITRGYNNKMDDTTFVLPKGKWILRLVGYSNIDAGNWFRLIESTDPTTTTARIESSYKLKVGLEMIGDTILVEVAQDTTFSLYYYVGGSGTVSILSYQYMVKGFKLSD